MTPQEYLELIETMEERQRLQATANLAVYLKWCMEGHPGSWDLFKTMFIDPSWRVDS